MPGNIQGNSDGFCPSAACGRQVHEKFTLPFWQVKFFPEVSVINYPYSGTAFQWSLQQN